MSASYIPKNVYAVCTFQTDSATRKFIDTRSEISVFYSKGSRTLLTIEDKNIDKEFPCKSPKNAMWSFLAFGAGLIVGALLLSNPIGWVIAAGIGVMAIGLYHATQISHKCTGALGKGNWKIEHQTVKFNKQNAITQNSMLICDAGGILSPIFSQAVAEKYAARIDALNNKEIWTNGIASFFGGAGAVLAFGEAAGAWGVTKVALWMGGTMGAVTVASYGEREAIRSTALSDNQHYQNMNEVDNNEILPGFIKDPTGSTPGDLGSPDIMEVDGKTGWFAKDPSGKLIVFFNGRQYIKDIKGNYTELKQGSQLAGDLKKIENVDPREMYKNAQAKQIVENIRQGKYSESLVKSSIDGNNVVRPRDLIKVLPDLKAIKLQNIKNLGKLTVKGGGLIAFVFPFVATWFSEQSRMELANAMAEDMNNGIAVVSG
ncbi:hypothetical protein [Pedobacter sp. CFBP9032]|uniref:hypothetical protein n=1 Tax=Pedobacter sp. CFBP9032 TaxID=3096539 RepID=UPI002A69A315|nr:hypothetical protein [Pedobacter sp. CFBP9032]MDY0906249.1 hypothetical protein [Pedobacter sp. CFBP9032]